MTSTDLPQYLNATITAVGWKTIGIKPHHGINIPLFSLRTAKSCGIGEYMDLLPVIDWCRKIGFDIIQILPVNDTGPESSPYSAISAFALNPIHLSLASLSGIEKREDLLSLLSELQQLNQNQRVDYTVVHQKKDAFLHLYYQYFYAQESQSADFQNFVQKNHWLKGYALFKTLKIIRQWQPWEKWPQEFLEPCPDTLERLFKEYEPQTSYHVFLQYLCFKQFSVVHAHAGKKGVFLKGDIPILISKESADVWLWRSLFNMDLTAGAPPDMYSKEGQNWQFPLYNWNEMDHQHYEWWQKRLEYAAHFYDIFRLDHIVGFFRIWAIPLGRTGLDGHFEPGDESIWINFGTKNLDNMLKYCHMLPIGEDLGVVPPEVKASLRKLGICGTKVLRWERNWNTDKSFINVQDYIPESMSTVSTHDSETVGQWWKNQSAEAQDYARSKGWNYAQEITFDQRLTILKDCHHSGSLFHINLLNEYLALIPSLVWPNIEDERINDPAVWSNKNWTYRFKPAFEEIAENVQLENLMKSMLVKEPS
jgi:4-alpha-glucanotransferase